MALEAATGRPVVEGRLYYATTDGGYGDVQIPYPQSRRIGVEVLEIVDRAVEIGFLAGSQGRHAWWARPVCGHPLTARRATGRALADLLELEEAVTDLVNLT
jgi:hypothetical protein